MPILFLLLLIIPNLSWAGNSSGWYGTLQGAASDVQQTSPPNGVTLQYNTTYDQWQFSYANTPAGGSTGYVLTKNSGSDYDYSWTAPSGGGTSWLANGNDIYSPNSGNVGIGTSVPTSKLQVNTTIAGVNDIQVSGLYGTFYTYSDPYGNSVTNFHNTGTGDAIESFQGGGNTEFLLLGRGSGTGQDQFWIYNQTAGRQLLVADQSGALYSENNTLDDGNGNAYFAGSLTTFNNTLDDGSGNMSIGGTLSLGGGGVALTNIAGYVTVGTTYGITQVGNSIGQAIITPNNTLDDGSGNAHFAGSLTTANNTLDDGSGNATFSNITVGQPTGGAGASIIFQDGNGDPNDYISIDGSSNMGINSSQALSISSNYFSVDGSGNASFGGSLTTANNTLDDGSGNLTAISLIKSGGTSSQFLKANGSVDSSTYLPYKTKGTITLVSGTKALTISGVTTSNQAFVQLVTPGGTLGGAYKAVCTSNTLTVTSIGATGTTITTDTSTLNYLIV